MGATLEKVWGSVSGPHKRPEPGTALLRSFSRFLGPPDFLHLELPRAGFPEPSARGGAQRVASSPSDREARVGGIVGTSRKEKDVGLRTPDLAPDRVGGLACGWSSQTDVRPQPLSGAGKQPVLSVDGRDAGVAPLASLNLPQTEDLGSLGKLPQLPMAGKDVALDSDGRGFSTCVNMILCKSLNFPEPISQL